MPYRTGTRRLTDDERLGVERLDRAVPRDRRGRRVYASAEGERLLAEVRRLHSAGLVTLAELGGALGCSRQAVHIALAEHRAGAR